jgi:hypothetical protein
MKEVFRFTGKKMIFLLCTLSIVASFIIFSSSAGAVTGQPNVHLQTASGQFIARQQTASGKLGPNQVGSNHVGPDINGTSCSNRTDLLEIFTPLGAEFCYANAGTISVNLTDVLVLTSGNNHGSVKTVQDGTVSFGYNAFVFFLSPTYVTITQITIL